MDNKLHFTEDEYTYSAMMEAMIYEGIADMAKAVFKTIDYLMKKPETSDEDDRIWTLTLYSGLSEVTNIFSEDGLLPGMTIEQFHQLFNLEKSKALYEKIVVALNVSEELKEYRREERANNLIREISNKIFMKEHMEQTGDEEEQQ
jgi:hypothetical protein